MSTIMLLAVLNKDICQARVERMTTKKEIENTRDKVM